MIASLRKALYTGNIERDKQRIEEIIDDDDLDELNDIMYEEVVSDEALACDVMPVQEHTEAEQKQNNDDVICLEPGNDLDRVRTGISEWLIDEHFSMQYGYTEIVSQIVRFIMEICTNASIQTKVIFFSFLRNRKGSIVAMAIVILFSFSRSLSNCKGGTNVTMVLMTKNSSGHFW